MKHNPSNQSLHALTAMYSSTGYVGLPIILLAFGDQALVPGIIGAVITGSVFMPLAIILVESDKQAGTSKIAKSMLIAVLKNPVVVATIAGLSVSALSVTVPAPIETVCELLGGAYIPCALFAAGLFMSSCSVGGEGKEIAWLVGVKLLIHPLVTWWLAIFVFQLEPMLATIAVLQAALPCGVPVFVLAQQYNTYVVRSSAVIVISTVLSVLTLSAVLLMLKV